MGPFDGTNYDGCDANFPRFPTESDRDRQTKSKNQLIRIDLRWETAALIALFALPSSRAHVCVCWRKTVTLCPVSPCVGSGKEGMLCSAGAGRVTTLGG